MTRAVNFYSRKANGRENVAGRSTSHDIFAHVFVEWPIFATLVSVVGRLDDAKAPVLVDEDRRRSLRRRHCRG